MPTGTVKLFIRSRGYGFIRPEGGGRDVFVHHTALENAGLKALRTGQRIGFDLAEDQGRPVAKNLREPGVEQDLQQINLALVKAEPACQETENNGRKPITRDALEQSLTDAVRRIAPECESFVGLILERVVPEMPGGVNWIVKGVRYGKADRRKCEAALGASLREKQLAYTLTDDLAELEN
jgi:CspA family cold shock protein